MQLELPMAATVSTCEHSAVQTWQSSAVEVGAAPSSRASAALEHATAQRQRRLVNFRGSAGFAGSVWVVGGGCWVKWVNHPRPRCCRTLRRIELFQLPDPDFLRGLPSGIEPSLLIYSFFPLQCVSNHLRTFARREARGPRRGRGGRTRGAPIQGDAVRLRAARLTSYGRSAVRSTTATGFHAFSLTEDPSCERRAGGGAAKQVHEEYLEVLQYALEMDFK